MQNMLTSFYCWPYLLFIYIVFLKVCKIRIPIVHFYGFGNHFIQVIAAVAWIAY